MSKTKSQNSSGSPLASKWLWIGLAVVLVGAAVLFFLRPAQDNTAAANAMPHEISVAEAAAKREAGAFLLDVRQPEEWNQVHIPGATLIPLGELGANLDKVPRDQEVVVVCRSGNRSAQGRDILLNNGFTSVTSMAGGVTQWQAAGYPTVSGP